MRALLALLLLTPPLSVVGCKKATVTEPQDPTAAADAIFERYIELSGGVESARAVERLHLTGTGEIVGQPMKMTMELWQERPDRMLLQVTMPGIGTIASGHADGVAWEVNPMLGPRIRTGPEAEDTIRRAQIDLMTDFRTSWPERSLTGTVEFASQRCSRIETTTSNGKSETLYFAVESGLYLGSQTTVIQDGGQIAITNMVDEYETVDGVPYPMVTRQKVGAFETITRFEEVQVNPETFPDLTPPAEILELVDEL